MLTTFTRPEFRKDNPTIAAAVAAQVDLYNFAERLERQLAQPIADVDAADVNVATVAKKRRDLARGALTQLDGAVWAAVSKADYQAKEALVGFHARLTGELAKLSPVEIARAERAIASLVATFASGELNPRQEAWRDLDALVAAGNRDAITTALLVSPSDPPILRKIRERAERAVVDGVVDISGGRERYYESASFAALVAGGIAKVPQPTSRPSEVSAVLELAAAIIIEQYAAVRDAVTKVAANGDMAPLKLDAHALLTRAHDVDRTARNQRAEELGITIPKTASLGRGSVQNADGTRTTTPSIADMTAGQRIDNARQRGGAA